MSNIPREVTFSRAPSIDGLLRLQALAGRALALPPLLDEMVRVTADALSADVVSIYLRDDEAPPGVDRLVMKANVGFPASAVGHVALPFGEGITGLAAECLRPVTSSDATTDVNFKPVSGLGEERFPAFLAVPFLVEGQAEGVLVAQRAPGTPFDDRDLAVALGAAATVAHAVDRTLLRPGQDGTPRPPSPVRLEGQPLSNGVAMGVAIMMPTWSDLRTMASRAPGTMGTVPVNVAQLREELRRGLAKLPDGPWAARLAAASAALDDARLHDRLAACTREHGVIGGLREVAREYALAPIRGADEETRAWLLERAREVEDFCLLLGAKHVGATLPGQGAVLLVPDRLGLWVTVLALGRGVASVVVAGPVEEDDPAVALVRGLSRPALSEVAGVYGWVRPGDRVLVDGTAGWLRIHPALADVAEHRRLRRSS